MKTIKSIHNSTYFGAEVYQNLNDYISKTQPSLLFILTDSHTQELCLPQLMQELTTDIPIEIIEIDPGEEHKTVETCTGVWQSLSDLKADRKSLLINLGGGVITDLGGFVASTFKRGINYINVPTSLLAMVDASVGGKTGVDLGSLKNQIGVINDAEMVLIDLSFLATLPQNQLKSGLSEMLKHGLIADRKYWQKMSDLSQLNLADLEDLVYESVQIKNNIVKEDPTEQGLRKTLNFGHTLGHAIESYFLEHSKKKTLLHGEAIAIGMILAAFISSEKLKFPKNEVVEIKTVFLKTFPKVVFEESDFAPILELLKFDKKNSHGKINFVLLEEIGKPIIDQEVNHDLIRKAFQFYAEE